VQPASDGQCTKDTLLFIHSLKTSVIKTERPSSANTVKDKLQDLANDISRHLTEELDILFLHVPEQDN
jgi:iron-sulfur cluster repair protein YtfE (RIC family)